MRNKSLNLEMEINTDATANFDNEKILQVIYNLLSNAIKFTPESGHIKMLFLEAKLEPETTGGGSICHCL